MGSFTNLAGDREVSLWYEPWLKEGTVGSSIDYVNVLDTNLHVKDLWHNGTWNFTAIPAWLKERILAVPVPSLGYTADCVIWVAKLLEHTQSNRHIYGWFPRQNSSLRNRNGAGSGLFALLGRLECWFGWFSITASQLIFFIQASSYFESSMLPLQPGAIWYLPLLEGLWFCETNLEHLGDNLQSRFLGYKFIQVDCG